MQARTETVASSAAHWLAQFERALSQPADGLLETLFHPDSYWRDVLALTWHIRTVNGLDLILKELKARPSMRVQALASRFSTACGDAHASAK